jgi:murein DD-endopeptidase MepM/ murein hydrolase activator NlpD
MSVGNGVVLEARYSGGNGNYVKIKHDKLHTTQYLHMSRFGPGIRSGIQVQQGQTIGYVGSTGLATGPHVCFRFWKNGQQVNHLRLSFPPPEPLPKTEIPTFNKEKENIIALLK